MWRRQSQEEQTKIDLPRLQEAPTTARLRIVGGREHSPANRPISKSAEPRLCRVVSLAVCTSAGW